MNVILFIMLMKILMFIITINTIENLFVLRQKLTENPDIHRMANWELEVGGSSPQILN